MARFQEQWAARPWHAKLGRELAARGRLRFRNAGLLLGEGHRPKGLWNLAMAGLLAPRYTLGRIVDMARYRLKSPG